MKKPQDDILPLAALVLSCLALLAVMFAFQCLAAVNDRLDAMPTVTTSGAGMDVHR